MTAHFTEARALMCSTYCDADGTVATPPTGMYLPYFIWTAFMETAEMTEDDVRGSFEMNAVMSSLTEIDGFDGLVERITKANVVAIAKTRISDINMPDDPGLVV